MAARTPSHEPCDQRGSGWAGLARTVPKRRVSEARTFSPAAVSDKARPGVPLDKVLILPLGAAVNEALKGTNRLSFLSEELHRLVTDEEVVQAGDVLEVKGFKFVVARSSPATGFVTLDTEFFVDGDALPSLSRVFIVGLDGPCDLGDDYLLKDIVLPYLDSEAGERRVCVLSRDLVIRFKGFTCVVRTGEPGHLGVVDADTVVFAQWEPTPAFEKIHLVPIETTIPRGPESTMSYLLSGLGLFDSAMPGPELFQTYLKPFLDANMLKRYGLCDRLTCQGVQFRVAACQPAGDRLRIGLNTVVFCEGRATSEVHLSVSEIRCLPLRELYGRWVGRLVRAALPEYQTAVDQICLVDDLMTSSGLAQRLSYLDDLMDGKPTRGTYEFMERVALASVQKAFGLNTKAEARSFEGEVPGLSRGNMFEGVIEVFKVLRWERAYLVEAMDLLLRSEDADSLQITLGLMRRGADECNARKMYAFNAVIGRLELPSETIPLVSSSDVVGARHAVLELVRQVVEETKDAAFKTTFLEPTKMYFRNLGGASNQEHDVDIHGANTYLALISATLGVELSRRPFLYDSAQYAVADFLSADINESLTILWEPDHFGQDWDSIGSLRRSEIKPQSVSPCFLFGPECMSYASLGEVKASEIANAAVDPAGNKLKQRHVAVYLERFTSWFSEDFFLPRVVSRLIGDEGRLVSLQVLRDHLACREPYWAPKSEDEQDVRFWLWDMQAFPARLRHDRAARLLQHAGALKPGI